MILTVAWRNIWRNKRRTLITAASIFFALFFALMMRSIIIGTFGKITDDIVSSYTGHIQIHQKGYWKDKSINNVFDRDEKLEQEILQQKEIKFIVPRLESFALASVGENTKGCMVSGIIPEVENKVTKLKKSIVKGSYLNETDDGAIIGDGLAKYLDIEIGDAIILIGQGYHAYSAAGKYAVKGIVHTPSPDLNNKIVYLTLANAQELYSTENRLTAISILLNNSKQIPKVKKKLLERLDNNEYEVMGWEELLFELKQLIDSKSVSTSAMLALLYMIVGFGVFGTVVMMTSERWREFGLLVSLGMKKYKLMLIIFIETMLLGALGIVIGFAFSFPIMYNYSKNPILLTGDAAKAYTDMGFDPVMVFSTNIDFMISQIYVVVFIVLISVSYPILRLIKLKPAVALKK